MVEFGEAWGGRGEVVSFFFPFSHFHFHIFFLPILNFFFFSFSGWAYMLQGE